MSYKFSLGERTFDDITAEVDAQANTKIDFEEDYIGFVTSGSSTLVVSGSSVGIGTTTPDYTLDVAGDIGVNQYIYHNGDGNTWINFTDNRIRLNAGGNNFIDCEDPGNAPHKVRINNGGNNIDFVIKDNSNNVYFTADASTSRIGIGTDTPNHTLAVIGDISASVHISASAFYGDGSNLTGISGGGGGSPAGSDSQIQYNNGGSFGGASGLVYDDSNTRVGIGITAPLTTLHVHADTINNGAVTISQADNSGDASQLDLSKARGSGASPAAVQNSDFIGQVRMLGYDGDSYDNFADIFVQAAGTVSTTSHPSKMVIRTTKVDATSPTTAVTIDENQDMTVAGVVLGKMRHMTHHRYNDGSGTGKEYIPWAGTSEQPNPSYISQGVAAYTGRLAKVLVRSSKSGGMGNTVVGIHIGTDGNTVFSSSAEETVSVNMSSANTTGVFNFTNANHFAAGDAIAVSIDPTNAHGNVNVTCVWEYQIT